MDARIENLRNSISQCGGTLRWDNQGRIEVDLLAGRATADGAAIGALQDCPHVKILRARLGNVSVDQLLNIATLNELQELMLQDVAIDDNTLIEIAGSLPYLGHLTLRNAPNVTDRAITAIADQPQLTHLALIDMQITGQSVKQIATMELLETLDLRMCQNIQGTALASLVAAPRLTELKVGGSAIDNAAMAVVATLPHLRRLTIQDAAIDGDGLSILTENEAAASRLEVLALARCSALTDDQLQSLGALRRLRQLTLRDMPVTGRFLDSLDATEQLELLSLNQTFLLDEAFERISAFDNLKRLELAQNLITPRAMECIAKLHNLEYLNLTECAINDDLLESLQSLPKLETIVATGNPDVSREPQLR